MTNHTTAFISIGSNLGNRYENCIKGIELLNDLYTVNVVEVSLFYQTQPVDFTDQDWFVNGALKIETSLDPFELIQELKIIENTLGQFEKKIRFGPRIIDLDIIFYGTRVLDTETLTIPHPRMHKRCFVLKPLCDIGADIIHPILKKTARQLLETIENDHDQAVMEYNKGGDR